MRQDTLMAWPLSTGGTRQAHGLISVPITFAGAAEFIAAHHRHHKPPVGAKFCVGCARADGDRILLCGVAMCGRPVARAYDPAWIIEVNRLCTDGTKHACSFLYARCARIARELGYQRIITYILDSEPGTSLKAAGWQYDAMTQGGAWSRPSRPRDDCGPTCPKQRWYKDLDR